jgi:ribosome recycling factor
MRLIRIRVGAITEEFRLDDEAFIARKEAVRRARLLQEPAKQILRAVKTETMKPILANNPAPAIITSENQPMDDAQTDVHPAIENPISDLALQYNGDSQPEDGWIDYFDFL